MAGLGLAREVTTQAFNRCKDHVELVGDEVAHVRAVALGMKVGTYVLPRGLLENAGNGHVFGSPVTGTQHRTVQQGTRGSAVAVAERVVVADLEADANGAHHRMQELTFIPGKRERASSRARGGQYEL